MGLAIVVALIRTCTAPAPTGDGGYEQIEAVIGLTVEETTEQLGEPTASLEFDPAEDQNPLRLEVSRLLTESGTTLPDQLLELSWFEGDTITTVWFVPDADTGRLRSIESVRYRRADTQQPD